MHMNSQEKSKSVQSLEPQNIDNNKSELSGTVFKALAVLDLIVGPLPSASAADIAEKLNMPRPTTNRIISNLIKLNYLKRDGAKGALIEGDRLFELSLSVLIRASQRGPRHQLLSALAEQTQETCNVGMIVDGQVKYLDRVEAQWPLSLRLNPGSTVPLHCSALGKVLLAYMKPTQREKYLNTLDLKIYTLNTITTIEDLRKELNLITKQGYSLDNEEYFSGVVGMAVPIPNGEKNPVLAIAVAAPSARVTVNDLLKDLPALREVAKKLALCC
jgi:IclR family acetate operon transcriptional repressor